MKLFLDIIKGVLIGIANIVPGVSGGTMAVSMGIYDKIIGAVTNLFKQFKKSILTLLPYAIGMLIAIAGISMIIVKLFADYPLPTASLFVGLIIGGLPIILKKVKGKHADLAEILLLAGFFALIIVLQLWGEQKNKEIEITLSVIEVIKLFVIGTIASATMVIPGVSGSMILISIGYYNPIIRTISSCIKALSPFEFNTLLNGVGILLPFGLGVVVGIFAIAKLIEYLLSKQERKTYFAILGLILASPFAVYLGIGVGVLTVTSVIVSIFTFAVGFVIAYYLGR